MTRYAYARVKAGRNGARQAGAARPVRLSAVCRRRITAVAANKSAPSDRQTPRIRWATNKLPPSQMIGQQASPQSISYRLKTDVRV